SKSTVFVERESMCGPPGRRDRSRVSSVVVGESQRAGSREHYRRGAPVRVARVIGGRQACSVRRAVNPAGDAVEVDGVDTIALGAQVDAALCVIVILNWD